MEKTFTTKQLIRQYVELNCTREIGFAPIIMLANLVQLNRIEAMAFLMEMVLDGKIIVRDGKVFKA